VADRKSFLLRIDVGVLEGVQRWANDDLRSLNAQIEFVLRDALRKAGRFNPSGGEGAARPAAGAREPDPGPSGPDRRDTSTDPDRLTDT
jgi:hypothetical protein